MNWYDYVACFFAGIFLANVVPHFVHGISWRPFPHTIRSPSWKRIVLANGERSLGTTKSDRRLHPVPGRKDFKRRWCSPYYFLRRHRSNKHNVERAICKETSQVTV